jgi:hypothetical protein
MLRRSTAFLLANDDAVIDPTLLSETLTEDAGGAARRGRQRRPLDPGHGRVMREWMAVPASNADQSVRLAEEARAFVARLP